MKSLTTVLAYLVLLPCVAAADVKSDILALTGNLPARLVWTQWPWCDSAYTPIQALKDGASENNTRLIGYSTEDGTYRIIDSTLGSHVQPRFTRKNGNYVIWTDIINHITYIRDFACTAPKRKLIDFLTAGNVFCAGACSWNPVTDSQYIYSLGEYNGQYAGTSIVRIPLKPDYTVDLAGKRSIPKQKSGSIDLHLSASADQLYIGCEIPQPATGLLTTTTGAFLSRHVAQDEWGCQQNIAPDNSYRFFYLDDTHTIIRMYGAELSTTYTSINLAPWMAGSTSSTNNVHSPRWSNDARFFTLGYPLDTGLQGYIFGLSAQDVKNSNASTAGSFCLAKFNSDFTNVEKSVRVSDGDVRHRDVSGDAWISSDPASVAGGYARQVASRDLAKITAHGRLVEGSFRPGTAGTLSVVNTSGRLVAWASGRGSVTCRLNAEPAGTYIATAATEEGCISVRMHLTR